MRRIGAAEARATADAIHWLCEHCWMTVRDAAGELSRRVVCLFVADAGRGRSCHGPKNASRH